MSRRGRSRGGRCGRQAFDSSGRGGRVFCSPPRLPRCGFLRVRGQPCAAMRLRTSLFLLSLATALPLVAFALLAAAFVVQHEYENLVSVAKARNRAVLSAVDAELHGTITRCAPSPSYAVSAAMTSHVSRDRARDPRDAAGWSNVLLHDLDGASWSTPVCPGARRCSPNRWRRARSSPRCGRWSRRSTISLRRRCWVASLVFRSASRSSATARPSTCSPA